MLEGACLGGACPVEGSHSVGDAGVVICCACLQGSESERCFQPGQWRLSWAWKDSCVAAPSRQHNDRGFHRTSIRALWDGMVRLPLLLVGGVEMAGWNVMCGARGKCAVCGGCGCQWVNR